MTKASKEKDAAWRFIEYALGPEGQRRDREDGPDGSVAARGGASPTRSSTRRRSRELQVFLDAIPTIRHVPTVSTWPEIEDAAEPIIENGMYRGQPVDEVVAEVDEATRPLFARAEDG